MNYKKIIFPAFILMVLVQLFVPASMIFQQEDILKTGKAFKFKTAPFDPYDPFRGKYIRLAYDANEFEVPPDEKWTYGQTTYVSIDTDKEGFVKIVDLSLDPPTNRSDYVEAVVRRVHKKNDFEIDKNYKVTIDYVFDRFYMEESKAFEAEQSYRDAQIDANMIAYALVKVKNGKAVIENVFIDEVPIKEVVERHREMFEE